MVKSKKTIEKQKKDRADFKDRCAAALKQLKRDGTISAKTPLRNVETLRKMCDVMKVDFTPFYKNKIVDLFLKHKVSTLHYHFLIFVL